MGEKSAKPVPTATVDDLPLINAIIAKGDRAEVGPGPNGTIKISHVKRVIVKSGQNKDAPASCIDCKSHSRCMKAAYDGNVLRCVNFGHMQNFVKSGR
ncbi:hypothetical protein D1159_03815 [Pseudoflavonifractor sp. 524-17]|nr:hypothetical protein [Pseudoflavonifractor sp. 524-17]